MDSINLPVDNIPVDSFNHIKATAESTIDTTSILNIITESLDKNKEWVFSGIGVTLLCSICSLLWVVFKCFSKKCFNPILTINGRSSGTLILNKPAFRDIEKEIEAEVNNMKKLLPLPEPHPRDPYQNPMILIEDALFPGRKLNAVRYEMELSKYHKDYANYINAKIKAEYAEQCFTPLQLTLHNEGYAAGEDIELELEFIGCEHVYTEQAKSPIAVAHPSIPIDMRDSTTPLLSSPSKLPDMVMFTEWDLQRHVPEKLTIQCGHLNGKKSIDDIQPKLYIDTMRANEVVIKSRVFSTDNKPKEKTIIIKIE